MKVLSKNNIPNLMTFLLIVYLLLNTVYPSTSLAYDHPNEEKFSIKQILSSPFPSHLVAAPEGARVAWVQNAEGVRNIWIAVGPEYIGRQVTKYDQDDGQTLNNLQFTRDEQSIIYVRGDGPNRQGELPNPLNDPEGTKQTVWIVSLGGGVPKEISEGSSASVSPKGDIVVFLNKRQVWLDSLKTESKSKQLFKIRGTAGSFRWSPDGSRLAFVSRRGDHSFIGIYHLADKTLKYLEPSVDRDSNPVWSPDGSKIVFMRIPNQRRRLPFQPRRSALPWSIRLVDIYTEKGHQVWEADEGTGSSFRSISANSQIFWGDKDNLVFPWEKDGWSHLYSVSINGGKANLLTPGKFEVQFVSLTPDRKEVLYSSNQNDMDRQHLWRVPVTGGTPKQITSGEGIEWSPVMTTTDRAIAFIRSSSNQPANTVIKIGSNSSRPLSPNSMPDDFPGKYLVKPQQVIFSGADGMRIHGQLFLPSSSKRGERHPAVLFFHGGSRRQMLLGFHHRGYYHNAYALNQYLASKGYIVLSVNYRSGIGYGMEFREALNYGARGASEYKDVIGAGLYLQNRPDVDPDRIGLWGGSYGGYLTALGLARASDLFAAGVDLHGVHDWNRVIRNFVPSYNANEQAEFARLAFESSPMAFVDSWRSPVLLIHGDDDRNVPFSESVDLIEALRKQGVEFEQLIFPDEVHGFLLHKNWLAAYYAAADFFDRKLKNGK